MVRLRFTQALRAGFMAAAALLTAAPAAASVRTTPEIRGVTVTDGPRGAAVALTTVGTARPAPFILERPNRLVIDIPRARLAESAALVARSNLVARIRHGVLPGGGVRIVFDLQRRARLSAGASAAAVRGGHRHVFSLVGEAPAGKAAVAAIPAAADATAPARRVGVIPQPPPALGRDLQRPAEKPLVVIDAGHGGRDPGAIGRRLGLREKEVTLRAARLLRDQLMASGRYRVVMTRDGDRFLELEDRVRLARTHGADLFISLHADSNPNPAASGASVYTLSERGVDRARVLANRHNWVIEAVEDEARPALVQEILMDLAQRETTNRSAEFAGLLIPRLGGATSLLRNTHRNAGFFVLLAPDVPAVLIELGFLTNRTDEARLADDRRLRSKAQAIARAVDDYFARHPRGRM